MLPRLFVPTLALSLALPPAASALEVHAHRGGAGPAPENSLPAFRAAIDLGVDALELDLQLSRDGVSYQEILEHYYPGTRLTPWTPSTATNRAGHEGNVHG